MGRAPIKTQALDILRSRGVPVSTVLDVGVLDATIELMRAYPDRLHILFEPVAEFAAAIERNYRGIEHRLVQAAVSDTSGEALLRTVGAFSGRGSITHSFIVDQPEQASRSVPRVSIDDYLRQNPAPGPYFLKVDVDGDELKVLDGAVETLKATSIVMVEATLANIVERMQRLVAAGFQLFDLTEPAYYDKSFWQCDVVFVRADVHAQYFEPLSDRVDLTKYEIFDG